MKPKVSPIPAGYHSITPYLIVDGAAKAIVFYEKALGAIVVMRMEMPNQKIGHAELSIGDSKFMLADEFPEMHTCSPRAYGGSPVGIHLYVENVDEVVKQAVSCGAKLLQPVETKFYGDRNGAIEDPYGHKWYISTHVEDVPEEEIERRAAQASKKN
ncbi:MAG: glyoxalase [Coxiella sp. RIFCSPHIGHO2_12_FULL_44_14]|nr:MAG: glyoxalase [Coxiella sp. RIFCSPHIGHO2_12_FULL_44_14]